MLAKVIVEQAISVRKTFFIINSLLLTTETIFNYIDTKIFAKSRLNIQLVDFTYLFLVFNIIAPLSVKKINTKTPCKLMRR